VPPRTVASPQRILAVFDFTLPNTDLDRTLLQHSMHGCALQRHGYVLLTSRLAKTRC
jgi:hypothetical protein